MSSQLYKPDRSVLFGVVGNTSNIEEVVNTPVGKAYICSLPGEDKHLPNRRYKKRERIVSEDFTFLGVDGSTLYVIVGDGVTNKGLWGREAAQICYRKTVELWASASVIESVELFKYWHTALAKSAYPQGAVAITIMEIRPFKLSSEPELCANIQFYSSGDVQGVMHTPTSRFDTQPFFASKPHRRGDGHTLTQAATGKKLFSPSVSPVIYGSSGDFLHCYSDGVEAFQTSLDALNHNRRITFSDLPVHLQGELYLSMLQTKAERRHIRHQIRNKQTVDSALLAKYTVSSPSEKNIRVHIQPLDDLTSVIIQLIGK